jgi:SpoVK/Ycf46/Vps4 family AAA+-type ATPase
VHLVLCGLAKVKKIIKQVFKDYKSYAKGLQATPILFFNEADAIIAKRKELNFSNVSDTENRIQNILLEEFENFEGILIATTNLVNNMDNAFERRFLFKVEFKKTKCFCQITNLEIQIATFIK